MQLNNIKRVHKWKKPAPVGRGSKRGKTSGRGTKGQKARAGRKLRPEIRDVIMRLPKLRGRGTNSFKSRFDKSAILKIGQINSNFKSGATVDIKALIEVGLLRKNKTQSGVKIIGGGTLDKAINLVGCTVSQSVKALIEKAGGSVKI